ncbi:MAG: hypothetical protein JXQ97_13615 [Natronospirillum sp.]
MISWLWRLAVIALITWIAVPFLLQEEALEVEEPVSTGDEVVGSALTAWQRFWAEQTNTTPSSEQQVTPSSTGPNSILSSSDGESLQQRFLQRLMESPEAVQLGREHVRRQAEEYGVQLTDEDVDRLLAWLRMR